MYFNIVLLLCYRGACACQRPTPPDFPRHPLTLLPFFHARCPHCFGGGRVQFLEETPGDEDLEQALAENKLVLVKRRHRIKALRNAISDLKSQRPHLAAAAASSPTAVSGVGGSGVEHGGDAISAMAASMSLDTPPAPSSASAVVVGGGGGGGVSGTPGSAASIAAPDGINTTAARKDQQYEDETTAREARGGELGGDGRGGVLL